MTALILIGMHTITCTITMNTSPRLHSMPSVAGIFNEDSRIVDKGPYQFVESIALMFRRTHVPPFGRNIQ